MFAYEAHPSVYFRMATIAMKRLSFLSCRAYHWHLNAFILHCFVIILGISRVPAVRLHHILFTSERFN